MMRALLCALLLAGVCAGQVVVTDHVTGAVIGSQLLLPDVPVNDSEQKAVDVVNTGATAVTIGSATVTGNYYSLCCESSFVLQPGALQTLTITFAPTTTGYSSGALEIDELTVLLFTRADAAASLYIQTASGLTQAHTGTPLLLALDSSYTGTLSAVLENNSGGPIIIPSLAVTGDFALGGLPAFPLTMQNGQQASFALISTQPISQTTLAGVVTVGPWPYAIATHPPSPGIHISTPATILQSGQQVPISITFDSAPTFAQAGTLSVSLTTQTPVAISDPAILFPSTGNDTASFSSAASQTTATFNGATSLILQTGTTAGVLHLQATWAYSQDSVDIAIQNAPVTVDNVSASKTGSSLTVTVTGFDNTRTAGDLSFSFYDAQGAFIGQPVASDASEAFYNYFFGQDYNAGGMFEMTAQFPVSGGTGQIASVQVTVTNTAGDTQSSITRFN